MNQSAPPSDHSTDQTGTLSYEQAGVNYDLIDPLKVTAQRAAAATAGHLAAHGFTDLDRYAVTPGNKNFLPDFFVD